MTENTQTKHNPQKANNTRSQAVARIADCTATKQTRSATFGFGAKVVSVSAVKHDAELNAEFNATLNAKIIYVHLAPGTVSCQLHLLVHLFVNFTIHFANFELSFNVNNQNNCTLLTLNTQ